jgi:uncharacterized protein YbbC (DUF1343 family)
LTVQTGFELFKLKMIGQASVSEGYMLATNHTAIDHDLNHVAEFMARRMGDKFRGIIAPEHGIHGAVKEGEAISDSVDPNTGVPVYSWYDKIPRIKDDWLEKVDTVVYDIQDGGVRFHTHLSMFKSIMKACSRRGIKLLVLDRPNPINGVSVQGNIPKEFSLVCAWRIPVRYGLTIGEFGSLLLEQSSIKCEFEVVKMSGWKREMWFDQTGLPWVPLSPNTPTLQTSTVYPGTCLFEGTALSVGRGTTKPFETIGSPWLSSREVRLAFNSKAVPGVKCRETSFVPWYSRFKEQLCKGIELHVTDRTLFDPLLAALILLQTILKIHGEQMVFNNMETWFDKLTGDASLRRAVVQGEDPSVIVSGWNDAIDKFRADTAQLLLYN